MKRRTNGHLPVWIRGLYTVGAICLLAGIGSITTTTEQAADIQRQLPTTLSLVTTQGTATQASFENVEDIRVGQRVITEIPDGVTELDGRAFEPLPDVATHIEPRNWRLVRLRAEEQWPDGTIDDINIETLWPIERIRALELRVDGDAPLPLDLAEMGLSKNLRPKVLAIEACPPIAELNIGRVVVTTVNHLNASVVALTLDDGLSEPVKLCPTALHKFYRVSDDAWVSAEDLDLGDTLDGRRSLVRVVGKSSVPGLHRVYNFTVEGDHVYRVSPLGALVHNNGCGEDPFERYEQHYSRPKSGHGKRSQAHDDAAGRSGHRAHDDKVKKKKAQARYDAAKEAREKAARLKRQSDQGQQGTGQ